MCPSRPWFSNSGCSGSAQGFVKIRIAEPDPQSFWFGGSEWGQRRSLLPFPVMSMCYSRTPDCKNPALGNTRLRTEPKGPPRPAHLPGKPVQRFLKTGTAMVSWKAPLIKLEWEAEGTYFIEQVMPPLLGDIWRILSRFSPGPEQCGPGLACPWGGRRRCQFTGARLDLGLRPQCPR